MTDYKALDREGRGLLLAATAKICQQNGKWIVPSQSEGGQKYTVDPSEQSPHCNCPDFELRGCDCKHIIAVRIVRQRELFADGSETVTETVSIATATVRKTYPQQWPAYNRAQTSEKEIFQALWLRCVPGLKSRHAQRPDGLASRWATPCSRSASKCFQRCRVVASCPTCAMHTPRGISAPSRTLTRSSITWRTRT